MIHMQESQNFNQKLAENVTTGSYKALPRMLFFDTPIVLIVYNGCILVN